MENIFETFEDIGPSISEFIEQDEQNGRLSASVFNLIGEAGLYRLFLPASLGGQEIDPVTMAKLIEKVARHHTAAAWSIMVAGAGAWWSKYLPAKGVEELFDSAKKSFLAGSLATPMKAEQVEGGYLVNGKTPLCSNVQDAQWITVLAIMMKNEQPVFNNSRPEFRLMVMKAEDCKIVNTWHAIGMKATDSNDVTASNIFVPSHLSGILSPVTEFNKYYKGALYRFPAVGINGCCLIVPVSLAIATNALGDLKLLTEKMPSGSAVTLREKASFQQKLGMAEALVGSARAYLHRSLSDCWSKIQSGNSASNEDKAMLLLAAAHTNKTCVAAVDLIYSAAGTTGTYSRCNISRYFTDIQVVRHHGFANENRFETAAQLLLGLPPDFAPAIL